MHPFTGSDPLTCDRCGLPRTNRHHTAAAMPRQQTRERPTPPVSKSHPATSHRAATATLPRLGTIRAEILGYVADDRTGGCTDDELEVLSGRSHQSVSASRNGLVADGLVEPLLDGAGHAVLRLTRTQSPAIVWTLTEAGRALAIPTALSRGR